MPYTLALGFLWFALAAVVGLVAGWVLRSAGAGRQVARAKRAERRELDDEISSLRERAANLERAVEERDRLQSELEMLRAVSSPGNAVDPVSIPDIELGAAVLGRKLVHDDLKAIAGIGPAIERLCHGVGIRTWWDLANASEEALRAMLSDAGPRFAMRDSSNWSHQARLLASGRWDEAKEFELALASARTS